MIPTTLKTFVHPKKVYKLEYPAHWDNLQQDDAKSCGFGPHDRDDVGLWISIMPMSVDTDRLAQDLPRFMEEAFREHQAQNPRPDPTIPHHAYKADIVKEGEAGNYWVVAGGDVVLFASTQVPAGERDEWNPAFDKLMASLRIMRNDQLLWRKVAGEVLQALRDKQPDQDFKFDDEDHIIGKNQRISLANVFCEVKESPNRRDKIIKNFVSGLTQSHDWPMGEEVWEEIRGSIIPVLKPHNYIAEEGPTKHLLTRDWLADVLICAPDLHQGAVGMGPGHRQVLGAGELKDGLVIGFSGAEAGVEFLGRQEVPKLQAVAVINVLQEFLKFLWIAEGKADGQVQFFVGGIVSNYRSSGRGFGNMARG